MATKTPQQWAQMAINVQNAGNMPGIARDFVRLMDDLNHRTGSSTDWCNQHPLCVMFADKIASLAHVQSLGNVNYSHAYGWCERAAKDPNATFEYGGERDVES